MFDNYILYELGAERLNEEAGEEPALSRNCKDELSRVDSIGRCF